MEGRRREDEAAGGRSICLGRILNHLRMGLASLKWKREATNKGSDEEKDKFACIKKSIRDNLVSLLHVVLLRSLAAFFGIRMYAHTKNAGISSLSHQPEGYTSCQAGSNDFSKIPDTNRRLSCIKEIYIFIYTS